MMTLAQTRQLTCRYWALGPRCPNVARNGRITCKYSHRDTGKMVNPMLQPGTCLVWSKQGVCLRYNCPYEHRNTGVTGMNQGPLQLSGTECEIADAAHSSGFDTHNHESLFKLIWAVKRLGIKIQTQQNQQRFGFRPRPPPHPIYPDNYRPSGVGDNTNVKRKRKYMANIEDDDEPPQFHPKKPLMRRRGTKDSPITLLDSDDEVNLPAPANSSKRRKVSDGKAVPGGAPMNKAVSELLQVKARFANARRDMNNSQSDMRDLFDKYYQVFDDDEIMRVLEELSSNMNTCFDGSKAGMESTERALAWLNSSARGIDMKIE